MTININKDITKIKPGGIRNFSFRQIKYAALTAIIVIPVIIIISVILTRNTSMDTSTAQTIAGFVGLAAGFPVALTGFYKKCGMTLQEYWLAKKECSRQEPIFYASTESPVYRNVVDKQTPEIREGLIEHIVSKLLAKKGEDKDVEEELSESGQP